MSNYTMERGWRDHPAFAKESYTEREAWEWLIENACWKETTINVAGNPVKLERGQLSYSVRYMAEAWGWTRSKTARFTEKLKKWDMIGTESGTGQQVITICNYNKYQLKPEYSGTAAGRKTGQQRDSSGTNKNTGTIPDNTIKEDIPVSDELVEAVEIYNTAAEQSGLPKCQKLSTARKQKLKQRLGECGGLEGWRAAIDKIRGSPFLTGHNNSGWKADFDFLCQERSFTKLMEGAYDHDKPKRSDRNRQALQEWVGA